MFTLDRREWHFLDVMAGRDPRWVTGRAGRVLIGKDEIFGVGITTFSFGSSPGSGSPFCLTSGSATCLPRSYGKRGVIPGAAALWFPSLWVLRLRSQTRRHTARGR